MAKIRDVGSIASKWGSNTQAASGNYSQGVQNPKNSWQAGALAAEGAYKAGVTEAANAGRYGKGVQAAGDATWQRRAVELGAGRFGAGVAASQDRYQAGFSKYAQVIASTPLPPRGAKGSPANLDRVRVMADALRKAKTGK